jgi:DedD protein
VPLSPPTKGALEGKAASKAESKGAESPAPTVPEAKAAAVAEKPAAKPVAEKPAAKVAEKPAEKAPEKSALPKPGTFFIQVTALADVERAKLVQRQIIDAGLLSYTQVVAAGNGNVTRVRAGPFATREEAEKAREKLQGIGLEGKVAEIK